MPAWAHVHPSAFWQAAHAYERKNGATYREMEIALPRELDATQRADLIREWCSRPANQSTLTVFGSVT